MKKRKKKKGKKNSFIQRVLFVLTAAMLFLCVASITYALFLRHISSRGETANFRIEVLNGTGEKGLAARASIGLRKMGIDVFRTGNADSYSYTESVLIARNDNPQFELLGELLKCSNLLKQIQEDSMIDATLILGADYKRLRLGLDSERVLP